MAAYDWVMGIVGLWLSWIAITVCSALVGTTIGVMNMIVEKVEGAGIIIPQPFIDLMNMFTGLFLSVWNFVGLVVFGAFIIYILISSLRRRPEEAYI